MAAAASSDAKSSAKKPALLSTAAVLGPKQYKNTIIWLHGLGDSSEGFRDIFTMFDLPETRVILPNAPIRPITCNGGMRMRGWYDIVSLGGRSARLDHKEDEKGIQASATLLEELVDSETAVVGSKNVIVGGFSQGAAMSLHVGLKYKEPLAGIIAASGYLLMHKQYPGLLSDANKATPVFAYHGTDDEIVQPEFSRASYEILKKAGANVSFKEEDGLGHSLSPSELAGIVDFITKRFNLSAEVVAKVKSRMRILS